MIRIILSLTILIVVILLLRKCLYYHISRRLQYALWLCIPLYLLLVPFIRIDIPVSKEASILERITTQEHHNTNLQSAGLQEDFDAKSQKSQPSNLDNEGTFPSTSKEVIEHPKTNVYFYFSKINCYIGYFIITATLLFFLIIKNGFFFVKCRRNRQFVRTDSDTGLKIYILEGIASPFLFWKNVYVTSSMLSDKTQFPYMFLHEYCHWKHKDTFWNILKHILMICFWFYPVFWIASYYEECDCELACDEAVLNRIGTENSSYYGDTLLTLALNQTQSSKYIITSTMGGRKHMLKDRIVYIASQKKNKKLISFGAICMITLFFAGLFFSFSSQTSADTKNNKNNNSFITKTTAEPANPASSLFSKTTNLSLSNNYYNQIKSDGNYLYSAIDDRLIQTNIETGEDDIVKNGCFRLGSITSSYLYYTQIEDNCVTIGRLSLPDLNEEIIAKDITDDSFGYVSPYVSEDETVYCEETLGTQQKCHIYQWDDNKLIWKSIEPKSFMSKVTAATKNLALDLQLNYIQGLVEKNRVFYVDVKSGELLQYDSEGNSLSISKNYGFNPLYTERGYVYTDSAYNIHLCSYDAPYEDIIIYSAKSNQPIINYGTYDETGICGFYENSNNQSVLVHLSWDGKVKELYTLAAIEKLPMLSAFNHSIAFYEGKQLKLIKY